MATELNAYTLAAKTTSDIDIAVAKLTLDIDLISEMAPSAKLPILNYLRAVRTHIELIEYLVTNDAPKIR